MSREKMAAAKQLIQEKKYTEARVILRTIDHPTARKWLVQLDQRAPQKKAGGSYLVIASIALLVVAIVIAGGVLFVNQQQQRESQNATSTAEAMGTQTVVAAVSTLEYLYTLEAIDLYATLVTYCQRFDRSQGDCRRWGDVIIAQKYADAYACYDEYDWLTDTNFDACLVTRGIAVIGDQPVIEPIDLGMFTDEQWDQIGPLNSYCETTRSENYCLQWTTMTMRDQLPTIDLCIEEASHESIESLAFKECIERQGIRP
jgi:hypothetical protein